MRGVTNAEQTESFGRGKEGGRKTVAFPEDIER